MPVLAAAALALFVHSRTEAQPGSGAEPEARSPKPEAQNKTVPGAEVVTVGIYVQNIHEIDVKSNSFTAEFYLWFRWKGSYDPTLTYEIMNVVNVGDLSKVPIYTDPTGAPMPDLQPDGARLQTFHVHGRFGHPFPLEHYPLDSHHIVISIEDSKHPSSELVFQVDEKGSALRPNLRIPGWDLSDVKFTLGLERFVSNFGDMKYGSGADELYSRVDFRVQVDRPIVGILSKTVIPIALILLITFGAFFCQPTDIDARLCLTITALISAVALQITAATELPPTGSLTLLDKIYILSYAAILAVTFACIAVNRAAHAEQPDRASAIDRWGLRLIGGGYFAALVLIMVVR